MKVEFDSYKPVTYESLNFGDVFVFNNCVFMKIDTSTICATATDCKHCGTDCLYCEKYKNTYAVSLRTGFITKFRNCDFVIPKDCKLVDA